MNIKRILLITICLMTLSGFTAAIQAATVSFQTNPIMGYGLASDPNHVVVVTGPQPLKSNGDPFLIHGGSVAMGPVIPHYSMAGDPLYQVGSPSVSFFEDTSPFWTGWLYSGSGVNLVKGHRYTYAGTYTFFGNAHKTAYTKTPAANTTGFTATSSFLMLSTGISGLTTDDYGYWQYQEIWRDLDTDDFAIFTRGFHVGVIPIPAAAWLFGSGLAALIFGKKWYRKIR